MTADFLRWRKHAGVPILYVAIVPEDCAPPDGETRTAMVNERDHVLSECVAMHLVMEGTGFKNAILRNALAAMQLASGKRDKKVQIHRTLEEALTVGVKQVPADQRFDPRAILEKAVMHGVATPPHARAGLR